MDPIMIQLPDLPEQPALPPLDLDAMLHPYALPAPFGPANVDPRYLLPVLAQAALPDNVEWMLEQHQQYHEARMREELRKIQLRALQQEQQQRQQQQQQMQFQQALQQALERQLNYQGALQHPLPELAMAQQDNFPIVPHNWPHRQQHQPPPPILINRNEYENLVRRMRQQGGLHEQQQPAQLQEIAGYFVHPVDARNFLHAAHRLDRQAGEEPAPAVARAQEVGVLAGEVADVQDVMDRLGRELEAQGLQMRIVDAGDQSDEEADENEDEVEEEQEQNMDTEEERQQKAAAKIARIAELEEENDRQENLEKRYTRECYICLNPNPYRRAVMTKCGHNTCEPCALTQANAQGKLTCPKCRVLTGYVRIFEELDDTPLPLPQVPQEPPASEPSEQAEAAPPVLQGPLTRKRKRDQEAAAAAL